MANDKLKIVLETNEELLNAIRRSVNEILILAIDEVEIHKNDSALYDEILAHRLGLIPLQEGRKLEEFEDKPNTKNQLELSLKAKGPCTVYSGSFKGEVKPIYDKMPIVILGEDQELQLVAFARLGRGKDHAKYSPGLVYYRHISEILIKKPEGAKKILEKIKDSLITPFKGNLKVNEIYKSNKDIDYIETLVKDESIEVKPGQEMVLFIESWGQKNPKDIFNEAVKVLDKNLKESLKALK